MKYNTKKVRLTRKILLLRLFFIEIGRATNTTGRPKNIQASFALRSPSLRARIQLNADELVAF
jgi:hypothetical protein